MRDTAYTGFVRKKLNLQAQAEIREFKKIRKSSSGYG